MASTINAEYIKSNLYGLIEKNLIVKEFAKINTHVLVIKEKQICSAISIEFGVISQGMNIEASLDNLENDIVEKIEFYSKNNNLSKIFKDEYNNLWPIYMRYIKIFKVLYLSEIYKKKIDQFYIKSILKSYPYLNVLTDTELMKKIEAYKSSKNNNSDTGFVILENKKSA